MIFARSPYIVTIDEPAQEATRLELFIWNGTGAAPAAPTYSLSKKVPSINNVTTYYNISPFIREYFNFTQSSPYSATNNALPNQYAYCNVIFKTYYTLDGVETLINTINQIGLDGYGYFEDGYNPGLYNFLLDEGTYYYPCGESPTELQTPGTLTMMGTDYFTPFDSIKAVYTPLDFVDPQIEVNLTQTDIINVLTVHPNFQDVGNKLQIIRFLGEGETVLATYYFVPQCECKYEVYTIDFVNRYGAWRREFFYKASTENIEITNNQFKLNPTDFPNYNLYEGQTKTFNTNAKRTYKLNTGWVEEIYKETIQELMLSEVIRVNGLPATLKTKSVEKFKSINTKTINYQMEFEMAYDVINSIS